MEQVAGNLPAQPAVQTPEAPQTNQIQPNLNKATDGVPQTDVDDIEFELDANRKVKRSEIKDKFKRLDDIEKGVQKKIEALNRKEQAAEYAAEQKVQQIVQYLKENPAEALRKFGIDPDQFSYSYLENQLKQASLTDEQRKINEYERQLGEYQTREQKLQQQHEEQIRQQEVNRYEQEMETQCVQAIEKLDLPKDPEVVAWMAHRYLVYLKNGIEVSFEDVAREVKDRFYTQTKSILKKLDDNSLRALIEDDRERIRGLFMDDVKKTQTIQPRQSTQSRPNTINRAPKGKPIYGLKDSHEMIDKKFGQRR